MALLICCKGIGFKEFLGVNIIGVDEILYQKIPEAEKNLANGESIRLEPLGEVLNILSESLQTDLIYYFLDKDHLVTLNLDFKEQQASFYIQKAEERGISNRIKGIKPQLTMRII